jgi:hypothetical protein
MEKQYTDRKCGQGKQSDVKEKKTERNTRRKDTAQ